MHAEHVAAGARMVEFSGWHMPVQYAGIIAEHNAVRLRAGLFDVSHMGEVSVRGPEALDYLQKLTCNDVSKLKIGRAHYNALMTPNGAFVDDFLIYKRAESEYLLVINAANTAKDVAWLLKHAAAFDASVEDVSGSYAQIALQGPLAQDILQQLVEYPLAGLKYYRFFETELLGAGAIVSRTGYTGEDGFEIYIAPGRAQRLWQELMRAGQAGGLQAIGLGARDTLRLEAKMALYGNDIDDTTTVLEADLGWIVKLAKGDFIGREVLARQTEQGVERKLIGFEVEAKAIARHGQTVLKDGEAVGLVTSGSYAPFLQKNIGLAYLPLALTAPGSAIEVDIRGKLVPARVVPTPFYKRRS